ncbi:MAG: hypothetical protein QM741_12165 [Rudaea sp.]|uniref:hypothetical protein n=1 Tax=Rudaea sp. TaxID=2136325 RepID=UPI0039E50E68
MSTLAAEALPSARPRLDHEPSRATTFVFLALLAIGLGYTAWSLTVDIGAAGVHPTT